MAYNKLELSQIPQRNKDLAFGFFREQEKKNKISVPQIINYLCFNYFNLTDGFDRDHCDKQIEINENAIIGATNTDNVESVYLKNVVSSGIHEWKFK